jgi:recombinational DNA repair protein RecR
MTLQEIDALIEDTKKLPRAGDKVALSAALGTLEVARQLAILNENLAKLQGDGARAAKAGK